MSTRFEAQMESSETRSGRRKLFRLDRRMPAAGWVAVGLLGAAVIAPASAVAASNLVGIVGSNGARAGVTSTGALQTAAASPSNFVAAYNFSSGTCKLIYKVPKHDGLIVRSVTFNAVTVPSTGSGYFAGLYTKSNCSGAYFLDSNPGSVGETTVPLDPGVALKGGTGIYVSTGGGVDTEVYINGYLVPAKAVTANRLPATVHASAAQRG
jgi:hypothetical protein